MNLKEAFRYQGFLDKLMNSACMSIQSRLHSITTTKTHHYKKANPDAEDVVEEVVVDDFYKNDDVITFMQWLIEEKERLTKAIGEAKASTKIDIDVAVATNKFRQLVHSSILHMLNFKPSRRMEQGQGYKFNVEGNQTLYTYEVEVVDEQNFDKDCAKSIMRSVILDADKTSTEIDKAMVETEVNFVPEFDVNDSFDDVVAEFLSKKMGLNQ